MTKKAKKAEKKKVESKFNRAEVMKAADSFGVSTELMAGALRLAGKEELTRSEVEQAIHQFKTRRV